MKNVMLVAVVMICWGNINAQVIYHKNLAKITSRGEYTSYISKDSIIYKIGDNLTLGKPVKLGEFSYIQYGDGVIVPIAQLPGINAGTIAPIKRIIVWGSRKKGYQVALRTGGFPNFTIYIENAIETGEIVTDILTSDAALEKLKKEKDKYDLGLITLEEYEKIKAELAVFIK
jgi:hypothetical protein